MRQRIKQAIKAAIPDSVRYRVQYAPLYRNALALWFKGDRHECPCCGGRFRTLQDNGAIPREACPRCRSLSRHRWMWLFLQAHTGIMRDALRLLHIAPEFSLYGCFSSLPNLTYWTTDIGHSDYFYTHISACMDLTRMGMVSGSLDALVCSHVLEHIPDDRAAMREVFRVLKPGGWALLNVPLYPERLTYEDFSITTPQGRLQAFGQHDHVRIYGRDYLDRLREAGFDVTMSRSTDLDRSYAARYRIGPHDTMCLCRKPG